MPGSSEEGSTGGGLPMDLSAPERAVLVALRERADTTGEEELARASGLPADQLRGTLQRLRSKKLARVDERVRTEHVLTARGRETLERGLPERRLVEALRARGSLPPDELAGLGLSEEESAASIGILRRRGVLAPGVPLKLVGGAEPPAGPLPEEIVLRQVERGEADADPPLVDALERRGLVRRERRTTTSWAVTEEGRAFPLVSTSGPAVGALTPRLLASGAWKEASFRPYDVRATVPYVTGARPNAYLAWLEEFADLLVGLGFEEAEGPLLETEFWNNDVLFMPQDHPARSLHDALAIDGIQGRAPAEDLLARVAAVHEGRPLPGETTPLGPGWSTPFDPALTVRPVLRSQTTAVSARFLARHPAPPFRMFSIDRNFRREEVDAQHHLEFRQSEGIMGESGLSIRHLVGLFRELAEGIGIRELKIRPSYFPFTEPTIEGYVRHPRLGWLEVFPGGLFRPEVVRPLGIDVPVLAWGIGVTRLAMVALGRNDIRELFADDLGTLAGEG